jgi:twitching motility protein PilT
MDEKLYQQVKSFIKFLVDKIPDTIVGAERQRYIGNEIIEPMTRENRSMLKSLVDSYLEEMRKFEASDIDIGSWGGQRKIWLRIHGDKKPMDDFGEFDIEETNILIQSILMKSQRAHLYDARNLDFSYIFHDSDGVPNYNRANAYFDMDALALNMRAINTEVRPYDSFGFHANVSKILSLEHSKEGLALVTGITGSGKSTTLDSIIDMNNKSVDSHIIILASPVEFVHTSARSIVRHREIGRDTASFKDGTIQALRQDPDIIVIGEMRDPDTIMAALEVADSGHKVLSTMHTSSAIESVDRIIGEVPPIEQERVRFRLADVLRCVISQKLCPSSDGKRIMAREIMIMTPSIRAAIKNNNTGEIYQMVNEGLKFGMITMEQDLKQLMLRGKIARDTAMSYANNKRMMHQLLQTV